MRPQSPKELLSATNTQAFLVSNLTNIRYLTGLEMSAGLILVTSRRMQLFADGRYIEMASKKARKGIAVKDIDVLKKAMAKVARCGYESGSVTVSRLRKWKREFPNTKFVHRRGNIEEFRRSKEPDELQAFRRAQKITREMLRRVPSALRGKITEKDLAWRLREWAHELGADDLSFDPIVAFGSHTSRPHHAPTGRLLKRGHLVQIDVGAKYKGYCADQSAVFFTKKATALQQRVFDAVAEAQATAIKAVKPGITTRKLDQIAINVLKEHGFAKYFTHGLGHGVGLDIHEGVSLSQKAKNRKLLKNEIITIEPGVYLPGRFGIRLEQEIVV